MLAAQVIFYGLLILVALCAPARAEESVSDLTFLRLTWLPQHHSVSTNTARRMLSQGCSAKVPHHSNSLEYLSNHPHVAHVHALGGSITESHSSMRGMAAQSITAPSAPGFRVAVPENSVDALRQDLAGLFVVEETRVDEHLSEDLRVRMGQCRDKSFRAYNVSVSFIFEPSVTSLPKLGDKNEQCQWHTLRTTNFPRPVGSPTTTPYLRVVFLDLCACHRTIYKLAGRFGCRYVELTPSFYSQNHVATITMQSSTDNTRPIWGHGLTGAGQIVGVGDTGLDHDSCYFRDDAQSVAYFPALNHDHRKILSYVPCSDGVTSDATDGVSAHGTHVSGSVAGKSIAGGDSERYNGMAKDAKIIFHDLTMAHSTDLVLPPDIGDYYGPTWSVGARISSNSWGGGASTSYSFTDKSSDTYLFEHQDLLSIFAAGNYATRGVIIPGSGKNILSIGAHDNYERRESRESVAGFSARGPTYDGRNKPDLMAPGAPVKSARSDGNLGSKNCDTENKQGTSMATPLVSGSAALLRQYLAEGYYPTGAKVASNNISNPSGPLMKALLIHSTTQFSGQHGPDGTRGFGRLELQHLFYFADGSNPSYVPVLFIDRAIITEGATHEYCFSMNLASASAAELVATVVWHDSGAAAEGTKDMPIVNDIDLSIVSQDGTLWVGNAQNPGRAGAGTRPQWDHTNNVEQVRLSKDIWRQGALTRFKVIIHGNRIMDPGPHGGQPYSLVVSAPDLVRDISGQSCTASLCPNRCNGVGQCIGGTCVCGATHHHVDCSLCNATTVCHGRGTCGFDQVCTCANDHFDTNADRNCGICKPGWYGPLCDFDCNCAHGTCDQVSGRCECANPPAAPGEVGICYDGQRCDKCCRDHGGNGCNTQSFWCANKRARSINITSALRSGLIQINGDSRYHNGDSCEWLLTVVEPGHEDAIIDITVADFFQIESPYDYVRIYGPDGAQVAHVTGTKNKGTRLHRGKGPLRITFFADLEGNDRGFVLLFSAAIPVITTTRPHPTATSTPHEQGQTNTFFTTATTDEFQSSAPTASPEPHRPLIPACRNDPTYCTDVGAYPSCIVPDLPVGQREYYCQCDSINPSGCGDLATLNRIAKESGKVAVTTAGLLSAAAGSNVQVLTVGDEGSFFTSRRLFFVFILPMFAGLALSQLFNRKLVGADEDAQDD